MNDRQQGGSAALHPAKKTIQPKTDIQKKQGATERAISLIGEDEAQLMRIHFAELNKNIPEDASIQDGMIISLLDLGVTEHGIRGVFEI